MSWQLDQFTNKDVVFVGVGKGRSMAGVQPFLEQHSQLRSFTGVHKGDGPQPLQFLLGYDPAQTIFIKNEAIPGDAMPVPYITPMQLFFQLANDVGATIIGITGTKGKSTTAALTAHVLQTAGRQAVLAGNIGVSPFTALQTATNETTFVLELSSYQLSDMRVSPHISACVNLYNDHTDWHGSLDNYWEAKHNIMRYAGPQDVFIYNPSFPALSDWAAEANCQTIAIDPSAEIDMSQASLFGDHNRLNALVVREISQQCAVNDDQFQAGLNSFTPLKHRLQVVATKNGHVYVDDAIGMTPESTLAGLWAIQDKLGQIGCIMLGGQDRDYNFSTLMQRLADSAVPCLVLFPDTIAKMRAALPSDYQPLIFEADDMSAAVNWAAQNAPAESVVLLSTAAPSYSLWQDFEDKGDRFQAAVTAL